MGPRGPVAVALAYDAAASQSKARAERWSEALGLPVIGPTGAIGEPQSGGDGSTGIAGVQWLLVAGEKGLELRDLQAPRERPLRADFEQGRTAHRRKAAGSRRQPFARAIGLRGKEPIHVIDATAGLGGDAFLLACLGCRVTAVERSAVLYALLSDGLERGAQSATTELREAVGRIRPVLADAREVLRSGELNPIADVVYLDPMFPPRSKSAAVRRDIRVCRAIAGDDPDAAALLTAARSAGIHRVVVKRMKHAPPLAGDVDVCFPGRAVRWDVYVG